MLILGLDTSSPAVSVALVELEPNEPPRWGRQASWQVVDARRHGELLATGIAAVLAELGVRPADLDAVAVGLGPGPYTSLRVGVVTAATVADALDIPAYGVCSLDAVLAGDWSEEVAEGAEPDRPRWLVVTDARRREVYWAEYAAGEQRVAGPSVMRPSDLAAALVETGWTGRLLGDGAQLYADIFAGQDLRSEPRYPTGEGVVLLAARRALGGEPGEVLVPLYLRRPDATPPGATKRAIGAAEAATRAGS